MAIMGSIPLSLESITGVQEESEAQVLICSKRVSDEEQVLASQEIEG